MSWLKTKLLSEGMAIFLLISGLLVLIFFLFTFLNASSGEISFSNEPDTALISKYGDVIGGLSGSLWSLAGLVLFYLALESQKESYELNRKAFDKQVEALTMQIEEFKAHGVILKRTAIAQEKTQHLINEEISLKKLQSKLDLYSSLANIHSDLAKIEDTPAISTRYKEVAAIYISKLNEIIKETESL